VALALALVSALVLALCPAGGSAVAVYTSDATDEKDAHCRVGYYIHDSADLLSSMEHLGSPREFPYFGRPDYSAKNLFKFSCSSQYECGYRQSNELCYHSSKVLALAKDNPSSLLLTRPTDAAIVCA
uniref:Oocyte maturation factor Mos n=1 Tax=Macrostomum lignano TaxID=282301 RepID=A0A1I8HW15_9PLAT